MLHSSHNNRLSKRFFTVAMSSGSQGSKNRDELGASPSHAPNKNQENLRPGDSWIPSGSLSSNNASKQPIAEAVGSDPVPCSVDRIQSYIGNECPEIYEYYSSIGKTMTDSRTKVCLEDLGINHDQSCSVLKSDIGEIKCRRFCKVDCLEDINKPEHYNYLPAYCIPEQSTMITEPVTSATIPSVTTRITSSTTINPATESDSGNTLAIGLGAGLGGLLLIALVILGIYCFKNRKRGEILEYYKPFDVLPLLNLDFSPKDT